MQIGAACVQIREFPNVRFRPIPDTRLIVRSRPIADIPVGLENCIMRTPPKAIGVLAFILWEAYWAYVFFRAPVPDEKMDSIFALLMAVILPALVTSAVSLPVLGRRLGKRKS